MEIKSSEELQSLAEHIKRFIEPYRLEQVLFGLRKAPEEFQPFVIGGAALFAIRFCKAGRRRAMAGVLGGEGLGQWLHLVKTYLLADPIGYDKDVQRDANNSNPVLSLFSITA